MAAKLAGLVRERFGDADRMPASFPGGAALRAGDSAWVLAEDHAVRSLGPALLWAANGHVRDLHLIVDSAADAGALARRAGHFRTAPTVWLVEGREMREAAPAGVPPEPPLHPDATPFADVLLAAGADVVIEHGMMTGEVLGLEVARVVVDERGPHLEVGVGKHDRHAQQLVHGDLPTDAALAQVIAMVREHRRRAAAPHPYGRLAPERWLRTRLVEEPALIGADHLAPVPAPTRTDDLRRPRPAPAAGVDRNGAPLVAVCSTGIDLDVVPTLVDVRVADGRAVVVVPERDDQQPLRTLVAALEDPADVVTVPDDWKRP